MSGRNLIILVLVLSILPSLALAATNSNIRPFKIHRIYIPAKDFASFMQSTHGQEVRMLPLAEARKLVEEDLRVRLAEAKKNKERQEQKPQRTWVALEASFKGKQEKDQFRISAKYRLRLNKRGWHSIPLLQGDIALASARVDGSEAKLVVENVPLNDNGQGLAQQMDFQMANVAPNPPFVDSRAPFFLLLYHPFKDKSRVHTINLDFLAPIKTIEYYRKSSFGALPVPKGTLELQIDGTELDVTVDQGLGIGKNEASSRTTMKCNLRPTSRVDVQWFRLSRSALSRRKKTQSDDEDKPSVEAPVVPVSDLPSFVEAQLFQDIAIGEGRLEGTVTVDLTIHRKAINSVSIKGPENVLEHLELLEQGDLVRNWKADKTKGLLKVDFKRNEEGSVRLFFRYYTDTKGQSSFTRQVPGFHVKGIDRENGFLAVRRRTNVSITQTKPTKNLEAVPLTSIPSRYRTPEVQKALLVYRYLESPYELELKVTRYKDVAVLTTMIDEVAASTLIAQDGNCLTKMNLKIRSRTRDPLEINLSPCKEAKMSEVLLDGKPASLSHRKDGGIEISLSDLVNSADEAKEMIIVFSHKTSPLVFSGNIALSLPILGATIKELDWTWVVPEDRSLFGFEGNHSTVRRGGSNVPMRISNHGYRRYELSRALLPMKKTLSVQSHYVRRTVQWLPWLIFLAGGLFFVHACLVTLLGGEQTKFYLSALLVILVVLILFSDQLESYTPAAGTGMFLYVVLLLLYTAFLAGGKVRERFLQPYSRNLTAVETNIARVAPEVEGGGDNA